MEEICSNCEGTGKVVRTIEIFTGKRQFDICTVCNGTGKVSSEKAYYSQYPDVSLRNAGQLISQKGKPVIVEIIADHEVYLHFSDGSKYVFGGFTVGYWGTGPKYTLSLLSACGFDFSMEEIVAMRTPITFGMGVFPSEQDT